MPPPPPGAAARARRPRPASSSRCPRSLAVLERGQQPALALSPVLEVLVDLRRRVLDQGPWPGQSSSRSSRAQALQRVDVGGQRAAVGRDEARAVAQHQVAAEADLPPAGSRRGRVACPGVGRTSNGPDASRLHPRPRGRPSRARRRARAAVSSPTPTSPNSNGAPSMGTPAEWSACECVSSTPAMPPRSSAAARTASRCDSSAGPGSITYAGPSPDHVCVRALERHRPRIRARRS